MSLSLNRVLLYGRLGRDPEMKALPGGQNVTTFSLATDRRWKDKSGEQKRETEWTDVVAYGKDAENIARYSAKGDTLYVEGRLHTRSWEDKQTGGKRKATEVVLERFQFGDKAPSRGEDARTDEPVPAGSLPDDDEVPFALAALIPAAGLLAAHLFGVLA